MCQGLAPLDGGDPDVLALGVLAGSPEYNVHDGLPAAVAWGGQVPEGFDVELGPVLLYAVPAQGGAQGPALEGCSEEVGVADGGRCEGVVPRFQGGGGWVVCRGPARPRRRMVGPGWAWPGWAVPGGFVGERWAFACFDGVLEACGWRWGACAGRGVG